MNIKNIWTETLLDYWVEEVDGDIFAHVHRMVELLGYRVTRNRVRLEILTRLRRYGYAPETGSMTPQRWHTAKTIWRQREFGIRELANGQVKIWRREELG